MTRILDAVLLHMLTSLLLLGPECVLADINGIKIASHEHAFATMHACTCRDLAFSLFGTPRKVVLDKAQPGKVQITVANRKRKGKGLGVEVEGVGLMGLAANAGIAVGDVILSLNGILLDDHQVAVAMLDSSERFVDIVLAEREQDTPMQSDASNETDAYRMWDESNVVLTGI